MNYTINFSGLTEKQSSHNKLVDKKKKKLEGMFVMNWRNSTADVYSYQKLKGQIELELMRSAKY